MTIRIYVVRDDKQGTRLVRAGHPAQALSHVAKSTYTVCVADQETLVRLLGAGVQVEGGNE